MTPLAAHQSVLRTATAIRRLGLVLAVVAVLVLSV
jgi:hypothetical protein